MFNQDHRQLIHDGREAMAGYLAENYCPTLGEHAQDCPENLAGHYPDMVNAVVDRCVASSLVSIAWFAYLIFVIFFTQAKFLETKIYTKKTHKLGQNTQ